MAEEFFAVYNVREKTTNEKPNRKAAKEGEVVSGASASPVWQGGAKSCDCIRLNAENIADAQAAVGTLFGTTSTVYVTKVASFKES